MSASNWHGCDSSDKALITGTRDLAANSVRVLWAWVRIITTSSMLDSTMALSPIGSPRPSWVSRGERKMAWPPSWIMPASNDTRVRVEDFSKIMPSTRFFKGSNSTPRLRRSFSSMPRRITPSNSSVVKSSSERKCLALMIDYLICNGMQVDRMVFDNGSDLRRKPHGADEMGKGAIL